MTYPDNKTIENWIFKTKKLADFEFSTTKKEINYLWKIDDVLEINSEYFLKNKHAVYS
jgi:hypothetical protein